MNVLIIEDEKSLRLSLADELTDKGNSVSTAESGQGGIDALKKEFFDLVISDLVMDNLSGVDVFNYIKDNCPDTRFVLMTAYGTVESAVNLLKSGALDYVCKPSGMKCLLNLVDNFTETIKLRRENENLKHLLYQRHQFHNIIGKSSAMRKVFTLIETISLSESTILIEGETGTGKEMVAEAIHFNSSRREKPFIIVSCAALSRDLIESELFGHERGAFTGALKTKTGRFEQASGGTLFLDEIDDIPLETQVKLLRAIETGRFERVGGENTIQADVRILAATKKNLHKLVTSGKFRKDLFYRLNVINIVLPPLRERKEDIPLLVQHFLKKFSPQKNLEISTEIMDQLLKYDWEGNVRELVHTVERLVLLSRDGKIEYDALPSDIALQSSHSASFNWGKTSLPDFIEGIEKRILSEALARSEGSKIGTARLLDIPLPTLKSKLSKFGLK